MHFVNKLLTVTFILSILFSCSSVIYPKSKKTNNNWLLLPNGAMVKSVAFVENKIEYKAGIENGKIIFLSTVDENFYIGGLKVDDRLPESFRTKEFQHVPGWGYFIEIESGWNALFDYKTAPGEESHILAFFQYLRQ